VICAEDDDVPRRDDDDEDEDEDEDEEDDDDDDDADDDAAAEANGPRRDFKVLGVAGRFGGGDGNRVRDFGSLPDFLDFLTVFLLFRCSSVDSMLALRLLLRRPVFFVSVAI
jgi:hypothetical protein